MTGEPATFEFAVQGATGRGRSVTGAKAPVFGFTGIIPGNDLPGSQGATRGTRTPPDPLVTFPTRTFTNLRNCAKATRRGGRRAAQERRGRSAGPASPPTSGGHEVWEKKRGPPRRVATPAAEPGRTGRTGPRTSGAGGGAKPPRPPRACVRGLPSRFSRSRSRGRRRHPGKNTGRLALSSPRAAPCWPSEAA